MTALIIWNSLLTIILVSSIIIRILIFGKVIEQIEAIKSWYPFCELVKIKVDNGELKRRADEHNFERD